MIPSINDPSWPPANRQLVNFLVILCLIALITSILSFIVYPWPVFSWQQLQELQSQEVPLYAFERGNLKFTLSGENYIIFERWTGNLLDPNFSAIDGYLGAFILALVALLSIASSLPRFWFYVAFLLISLLLSSFRWESLMMFGRESRLVGIILIALPLSLLAVFHFFQSRASLLQRMIIFLGLFLLICGGVHYLAPAPGLRLLAVNTLPAALILLVVFIVLVSHQVIASFVSLAVSASKKHSLQQFLAISFVYLLNLWLTYLSRIGWMEWDYILPSFLLLTVSTLLAIYSFRRRMPLYEGIFKSEWEVLCFMLCLAALALSTYRYFMATANDVVLLSIADLVLYTHIGFGMMFVLYVASNFLGVFEKQLPVDKVLYKPTTMPYFTYRFAGLIFTLALVFYNNWMTHAHHAISGYYTALGDIYAPLPTGKAYTYYKRAHFYAPYNQHAATALSELEGAGGNYSRQLSFSADANRFQPTEFTLLNTDHLYVLAEDAYDEIMLLRTGKDLFPSSGPVLNNLALAYSRVRVPDSAEYYFRKAQKDSRTKSSAAMNLLGVLSKRSGDEDADSIFRHAGARDFPVKANALALANKQGRIISAPIELPKDSILNLFTATLLSNYLTNHTHQADTSFISSCVSMARRHENVSYRHMVLPAAAKACYAVGLVNKAVQLLQEAVMMHTNEGLNNYNLGLMMMDQRKHGEAISYFLYALNQNFYPASPAIAVCLAEAGRIDESLVAWDSISRRKDSTLHAMGESMKRVLAAPANWFSDLSEPEKLYYALYRIPLSDSVLFNRFVVQIADEDLRAKAHLNRARKYFAVDEIKAAARAYGNLRGLHLRNTELFAEIKYFELQLLAAQGRLDAAQAIIDQGVLFGPYRETERLYYEGLRFWAAGDSLAAAQRFDWLARNNWYFDEGVVAAARFFIADLRVSYRILSDALQVNQHSVKILKAFIPVALARGFDRFAVSALETLRSQISPEAFQRYVTENQLSGLPVQ